MKWYNIIKGLTPEEEEAADAFLIEEDEGNRISQPQRSGYPDSRWVRGDKTPSLEGQKAEKEIGILLRKIEAAQQEIKYLRKLVEEEE